jgi:hypothetical protein
MEQSKILAYAKKQIELGNNGEGVTSVSITKENTLLIEVNYGYTFELSQKEIEYRAEEFLQSELQDLKN